MVGWVSLESHLSLALIGAAGLDLPQAPLRVCDGAQSAAASHLRHVRPCPQFPRDSKPLHQTSEALLLFIETVAYYSGDLRQAVERRSLCFARYPVTVTTSEPYWWGDIGRLEGDTARTWRDALSHLFRVIATLISFIATVLYSRY